MRPSTRQIRRIGIRYGVTYHQLLHGKAALKWEYKLSSSQKTTGIWNGWQKWREELAQITSFLNHIPKLRFPSSSGGTLITVPYMENSSKFKWITPHLYSKS